MLTNPLHEVGWLAQLRTTPQPAHQLVGHLLTDTGPRLTMYWLDKLAQYGPRTGIPGLLTHYDVRTFAIRYESLIEQQLLKVYPHVELSDMALRNMFTSGERMHHVPTAVETRRRRCRLAVFLSVASLHRENPPQFIQGRQYEILRHLPHEPYLP